NVLLCEDFESGVINAGRWQQVHQNGGTVAVDAVHSAARGTHSLHAHSNPTVANAVFESVVTHIDNLQLPSPLYVREFVYVGTLPTGEINLAQLVDTAGSDGISLAVDTGTLVFDGWGVS